MQSGNDKKKKKTLAQFSLYLKNHDLKMVIYLSFEAFKAVEILIMVFLLCSLSDDYQHFRGP
jgi:hypothetical protein